MGKTFDESAIPYITGTLGAYSLSSSQWRKEAMEQAMMKPGRPYKTTRKIRLIFEIADITPANDDTGT